MVGPPHLNLSIRRAPFDVLKCKYTSLNYTSLIYVGI